MSIRKLSSKRSSSSSKQTSTAPEPPLPPIVAELRPWVVAKFSAGYCDVSCNFLKCVCWHCGLQPGNVVGQLLPRSIGRRLAKSAAARGSALRAFCAWPAWAC